MDTEPVHEVHDMGGEADADRHVADGVFQDEVPTDDPGDQFTHGGVSVGVGAASDGDHRGQFGIAEAGEGADNGYQHDRKCEGWSGSGAAGEGVVVHQVVQQRGIEDGAGVEFFASDGGADDGEDAGADDRADAERSQRPGPKRLLQTVLGEFRVADQFIDRFGCEQLPSQRLGSSSADCGPVVIRSSPPSTSYWAIPGRP